MTSHLRGRTSSLCDRRFFPDQSPAQGGDRYFLPSFASYYGAPLVAFHCALAGECLPLHEICSFCVSLSLLSPRRQAAKKAIAAAPSCRWRRRALHSCAPHSSVVLHPIPFFAPREDHVGQASACARAFLPDQEPAHAGDLCLLWLWLRHSAGQAILPAYRQSCRYSGRRPAASRCLRHAALYYCTLTCSRPAKMLPVNVGQAGSLRRTDSPPDPWRRQAFLPSFRQATLCGRQSCPQPPFRRLKPASAAKSKSKACALTNRTTCARPPEPLSH